MLVSADILRLAFLRTEPPAAPVDQALLARLTGESIAMAPTVTNSNELDPSGQVRDSILTGASTSGGVNFEASRNPWLDEMLAAAACGAWGVGEYDGAAVAADQLVPSALLSLYTIEKAWTMPDDSESFHRFLNCAVAGLSLAITPGEPITGAVTISGGPMVDPIPVVPMPGVTYLDPGDHPVMTAPLVTELSVDLGTVSTRCFGTFNLNLINNVRGVQCIGTLGEREKVLGRIEVTLAGTVYFASNDMLQHLLDQDTFPVTLRITDSNGEFYAFEFPRVKVTAAPVVAGGTGQDVVVDLAMQALYDSTKGSTFLIERSAEVFAALALVGEQRFAKAA
jgi:hypothetical protein